MIETFFAAPVGAVITVTFCVMGFAAFMTGQSLAGLWRPAWHVVPFSLLLGLGDRFLLWALFGGKLLSPGGFVAETAVLLVICYAAYRLTLARKMVMQYPWLYERSGPFGWRFKDGQTDALG